MRDLLELFNRAHLLALLLFHQKLTLEGVFAIQTYMSPKNEQVYGTI